MPVFVVFSTTERALGCSIPGVLQRQYITTDQLITGAETSVSSAAGRITHFILLSRPLDGFSHLTLQHLSRQETKHEKIRLARGHRDSRAATGQ